jgi:hypothetical protein
MREDLKIKLGKIGGIILLAVLVSYSMYQGRDVLFGSPLSVAVIDTNSKSDVLNLTGSAPHSKSVLINGRPTSLARDGSFAEPVALLQGFNVITVSSIDTFGKAQTKIMYTFHQTPTNVALSNKPASAF